MNRLPSIDLRLGLLLLMSSLTLASAPSAVAIPVPVATTTTLATASSTVTSGVAVTLKATVSVAHGAVPVSPGLVLFCDAGAAFCEGPSLLGTAQLTSTGTATWKQVLGIGNHSVKAVFSGTHSAASSSSTVQSVSVTGTSPTATLLSLSGAAGAYTVHGTVGYLGLATPGTAENINFIDTTNGNLQLATGTLGAPGAAAYSFTTVTGSPFAGGMAPVDLAQGDFDNDGIADLAVANYLDGTVTIYKGTSAGRYRALGPAIPVGSKPVSIRTGDFNSDDLPDLVVVNAGDATFTVLLGDGRGSFIPGPPVSTLGNGPSSIAVLDADGDGVADLSVVNQLTSTLAVFLGDDNGNFAAMSASPMDIGGNPASIVAGDFNDDGLIDIAIANSFDGTVSIFQNDGTGTFTDIAGSPFSVTAGPSSLIAGDFDGDGRPDLAVLDANANAMSILLNKATGIVSAGASVATGSSPAAVVNGDFNGDGKQDLAITNANDSTVTVFFGDGAGQFSAAQQSLLSNFNAGQAIAGVDTNGDGFTDLAVANLGSNSISIRELTVAQMASTVDLPLTIYGGGTHQVKAVYDGDGDYAASTSSSVTPAGSLIPTTSSLHLSPGSSVQYGAAVQLTSALSPGSLDNYTATGTVSFHDGAGVLGTAGISNGQAVISTNSMAPGTHVITTSYAGDDDFAASTSAAAPLTITRAGTTTILTVSATSISAGATLQLTATITSSAMNTPTGTVSFYEGTTLLNTASLMNGVAILATSTLTAGIHTLTAAYSGDANSAASVSTALSETVSNDFGISTPSPSGSGSGSPTQTVLPGGTAVYVLSVAPKSGVFAAPVTLSVSGYPPGARATLSPSTLPAGSSQANVTLIILLPPQVARGNTPDWLSPAVVGLLILPFSFRRVRRAVMRERLPLLLPAVLMGTMGLLSLTGCGRNTGRFGAEQQHYTITITATSGTVSHSTQVLLTVE